MNKKIPCDQQKKEYKCDICKVNFLTPAHQRIHEQTKKHIENKNKKNNINAKVADQIDTENELLLKFNNLKIDYNNLKADYNNITNNYNNLKADYNNLQNENTILKQNINKDLEYDDKIYIIHERTSVKLNNNIYKIGKTKNIKNRLNGYPKGSKLLFTMPCKDCNESEKLILNYLKNNDKYIHAKSYGNEYFKCDLQDLMFDIINIIKNQS